MLDSFTSFSSMAIAITTTVVAVPVNSAIALAQPPGHSLSQPTLTGDLNPPTQDPAILPSLVAQARPGTLLQQQGTLASGDAVLASDGSLYDLFTFQGQAGQQVTIYLESQEFDTYLILNGPDGSTIDQNDDIDSNNLNSSLTLTLPSNGTYTVLANSYDSSGRGRYTITVTSPSAAASSSPPSNSAGAALPGSGSLPDNTRFAQQNFSQALFQQIHQGAQICTDYGLEEWCSYTQRYMFSDAILLLQKEDTASVGYTLAFLEPVSRQQGISYAGILDDEDSFTFDNPSSQSDQTIAYESCHFEDDIFLCNAELHLTPDGRVSSISVYYSSP